METTRGLSIFFIAATISSAAAGEPPGLFIRITMALTPSSSDASLRLFVISSDVAIPKPVGILPVSMMPCTYITSILPDVIPRSLNPKMRNRLPAIMISKKKTIAKYKINFFEPVIMQTMRSCYKSLSFIIPALKVPGIAGFDKLIADELRITVMDDFPFIYKHCPLRHFLDEVHMVAHEDNGRIEGLIYALEGICNVAKRYGI